MASRARERLTYANVMATAAVFLALGGGAYAANVAKNSVGASQIKKNAVAASEIKANAVGASETATGSVAAAEVIDGSVGTAEVAAGSLLGADIAANTLGGAQINEATLFNDDSLTGADISEGTLSGITEAIGGQLPSGGQDTLQLAEGSLTYECGQTLTYENLSGAAAQTWAMNGAHVDSGSTMPSNEAIFAGPGTVNDGATQMSTLSTRWAIGAIVTDDHVARYEIWDEDVAASDCIYAVLVSEVPRS
jgi:trimeric autotransporter adhesin